MMEGRTVVGRAAGWVGIGVPGAPSRSARKLSMALCVLSCGAVFAASPSEEVEVSSTRTGEEMTLTATMYVPVKPRVAWAVLTDFDRMARWVPNLQESRVVSKPGERPLRLAQAGMKRVGLLTFAFESVREIELTPMQFMKVKGLSGNMRKWESTTRLSAEGEGTRVDYHLQFIPSYWVPPLIGPALITRESRLQFEAIIAEMKRRKTLP